MSDEGERLSPFIRWLEEEERIRSAETAEGSPLVDLEAAGEAEGPGVQDLEAERDGAAVQDLEAEGAAPVLDLEAEGAAPVLDLEAAVGAEAVEGMADVEAVLFLDGDGEVAVEVRQVGEAAASGVHREGDGAAGVSVVTEGGGSTTAALEEGIEEMTADVLPTGEEEVLTMEEVVAGGARGRGCGRSRGRARGRASTTVRGVKAGEVCFTIIFLM